MFLHKITNSFATNSSSSHSLLFLRANLRTLFPNIQTDDRENPQEILEGEDRFLLTTVEEKRLYFAARLSEGFEAPYLSDLTLESDNFDHLIKATLAKDTVSKKRHLKKFAPYVSRDGYIREIPYNKSLVLDFVKNGGLYEIFGNRAAPNIPAKQASRLLKAVLPQDDLSQKILSLFEKDNLEVASPMGCFANASLCWASLGLDFFQLAFEENLEQDLRVLFLRDLLTFLEREDVVFCGGASDDGGWCKSTAHREVDPTALFRDTEPFNLIQVAQQDARWRATFPAWLDAVLSPTKYSNNPLRVWGERPQYLKSLKYFPDITFYDAQQKYWVSQQVNEKSIIRSRWSSQEQRPSRASVPEVVDLKITNSCPYKCPYCYQASTPQGVEGFHENLVYIVDALAEWGVMEVAIGGGEPTIYPKLKELLLRCRLQHVIPNITTRNLSWIKDTANRPWINWILGGVGYSVDTTKEILTLRRFIEEQERKPAHKGFISFVKNYCKQNAIPIPKDLIQCSSQPLTRRDFTIHIVLGVRPWEETKALMDCALKERFPILLLDFKPIGFAKNTEPLPYGPWVKYVVEKLTESDHWCNVVGIQEGVIKTTALLNDTRHLISIDTPLAGKYEQELLAAKGVPMSFDTKDGEFSFYIDGTRGVAGTSSYTPNTFQPFAIGPQTLPSLQRIFSQEATAQISLQEEEAVLFS